MKINSRLLIFLFVFVSSLTSRARPGAWAEILFQDVIAKSGIDFKHTDGSQGRYFIEETVASGLALLDYNGDGVLDIYFVNAVSSEHPFSATQPVNRLYRNEGDWRFTDVTHQAGVAHPGFGIGCTVGDYDNDGDPDLYITNYGKNCLYRNNGDGTFTDVTDESNTGDSGFSSGSAFADFNNDGWLDLYVANYIKQRKARREIAKTQGYPRYSAPSDGAYYAPPADTLYLNNGDGTFTDASDTSNIASSPGLSLGVVACDIEQDGDMDVYVACDVFQNLLFINNGQARFEERGLLAGVAYDFHGEEQGGMGVTAGDPDQDLDTDLHVTNYQSQYNAFYRNDGDGLFLDETVRLTIISNTFTKVGWGTHWADFDNDADLDLFIANGHLQDTIDSWDQTTSYQQRNQLFLNTGEGRFAEMMPDADNGLSLQKSSRGSAVGDLDNDGDLDLVISNSRDHPTLLRNMLNERRPSNWLRVKLTGAASNHDAIGARVYLHQNNNQVQFLERTGGGSYCSQCEPYLHFGLASNKPIDQLRVVWPDQSEKRLENVKTNQLIHIKQ